MDLDGYSRRAEDFTTELAREHYRRFAGLTAGSDGAAIYARHSHLFQAGCVEDLRSALEEAAAAGAEDAARRARALLRFSVEGHLASAELELELELSRLESTAWVEISPTDRVRYGAALPAQSGEADPERRRALDAARRTVAAETLSPVALQAWEQRRDRIRQLGWRSYRAFHEQTSEVDLDDLGRQADALLRDGAQAYRTAIDSVTEESPAGSPEVTRADLPWIASHGPCESRFSATGLTRALAGTLTAMGIASVPRAGLTLDVAQRPGKSPRAFCVAVRVPGEVYLVLTPRGGRQDYLALMHEAGHAQHFAATDPRLPFELRRLGDPAVGEAFAFLFEELVSIPRWVSLHLGIETDSRLAAHAVARRLILLRRYAAKLGHELALYGEDRPSAPQLAKAYAARMSKALMVEWSTETWLTDVDPGLYVASYLRAWALEAKLRAALEDELGEDWFSRPQAGTLLTELWRLGQSLSAAELLDRLCPGARLDLAALSRA